MLSNYFRFELNKIQHTSIRNLVTRILNEKVPEYFSYANVSNSSYYMSTKDGSEITIKGRTKASVRLLTLMLSNPLVIRQFTDIQKDYMIAALILHDTTMKGISSNPSNYQVFEHPITFSMLMPDNLNQVEYEHFSEITRLITTHHGVWNRSDKSPIQLPEVSDNMQFYVHLCDYLASKTVLWLDIDDSDDVIRRYGG